MNMFEILTNICRKSGVLSDDVIVSDFNQGNCVSILNMLSLIESNANVVANAVKMVQYQAPMKSIYLYLYHACATTNVPFTKRDKAIPKELLIKVNTLAKLANLSKSRALEILQILPNDDRLLKILAQVAERGLTKPVKIKPIE